MCWLSRRSIASHKRVSSFVGVEFRIYFSFPYFYLISAQLYIYLSGFYPAREEVEEVVPCVHLIDVFILVPLTSL